MDEVCLPGEALSQGTSVVSLAKSSPEAGCDAAAQQGEGKDQ